MMASREPRILVVGCGAIGGVLTAALAESQRDVTVVTTNEAIHAVVKERGLTVIGGRAPRRVRAKVSLGVPHLGELGEAKFDYVVLATQPPQVEEAARSVLSVLADGGAMVCLQNGLCERRLAKIAGEDRVIGAVVGWGATMPEPGVYEKTAKGGFTVGYPSGKPASRKDAGLLGALATVGPVETTRNLAGKRWSKLAINCAISTLGTLGGDRLGVLMRHRTVRRLALEIMTEVALVARAEGVRLEKVSGTLDLAWIMLTEEERRASSSASLVAKHALLLAVGLRYRRMRSSMLSAIERGRTPAVDFLNGEVVEHALARGIPVPVNARVRDAVWAIANGQKKPGIETLREIYGAHHAADRITREA